MQNQPTSPRSSLKAPYVRTLEPAAKPSSANAHAGRVGTGTTPGFEQVVEQFKDPLVGYLYRLSRCHATAEDLAQETFVRFYEHRNAYREQGQLSAYLYKMATNLLRSHQRKTHRRRALRQLFLGAPKKAVREGQQDHLESSELRSRLAREITGLPLNFRVPLVLKEIEGWSYEDIAQLLDCRLGTVKSRVHRAKKMLQLQLEDWRPGSHSARSSAPSEARSTASPDVPKPIGEPDSSPLPTKAKS